MSDRKEHETNEKEGPGQPSKLEDDDEDDVTADEEARLAQGGASRERSSRIPTVMTRTRNDKQQGMTFELAPPTLVPSRPSSRPTQTTTTARASSNSKAPKSLEQAPPTLVPPQKEEDVKHQKEEDVKHQKGEEGDDNDDDDDDKHSLGSNAAAVAARPPSRDKRRRRRRRRRQHRTLELAPPTLVPQQQEIEATSFSCLNASPNDDERMENGTTSVFPGAYRVGGRRGAQQDDADDDTILWTSLDHHSSSPADTSGANVANPAVVLDSVLAEEMQRMAMEETERRLRDTAVMATNVPAAGKKTWISFVAAVIIVILAAVGVSLGLTLGDTASTAVAPAPTLQPSSAPSSIPSMSPTMNPWIQLGPDIDGETVGDWSGHSVYLSEDGMTLAIGAPKKNGNGIIHSGHVRVHRYLDGSWVQLGQDIDGRTSYGQSGWSVSMSANGSMVAIGAPYAHNRTGYVQVYRLEGGAWSQVGSDMNGTAARDWFGGSVSMSFDGNSVVVGASGWGQGYAQVYYMDGDDWSQVGQTLVGEAARDWFGSSVSMSADGETVAIGGRYNDGNGPDSGHVRVYHLEGSNWSQVGQDLDGEASLDQSGKSVALSANGMMIAIGAWKNNNDNGRAGHVRVYTLSGTSWRQVGQDMDGKAAGDEFGTSVALSDDGTFLAAGANQRWRGFSGSAAVYHLVNGFWEQVGPDLNGEAAGDHFGHSISMSSDGRTIAIGANQNDGSDREDSGYVQVYQLVV